jgi:hypothetical protein
MAEGVGVELADRVVAAAAVTRFPEDAQREVA